MSKSSRNVIYSNGQFIAIQREILSNMSKVNTLPFILLTRRTVVVYSVVKQCFDPWYTLTHESLGPLFIIKDLLVPGKTKKSVQVVLDRMHQSL